MSALLHVTHNRDLLIEQHRSYVRALAIDIAKTLPRHIDLEELVAYGNLGLIEAAERYDPRYRASFKTFAWYRIRGAIFDAVRQMGPFSRASHSNLRRAAYANDILQTMAEGELSPDAVSAQSVPDKAKQTQAAIEKPSTSNNAASLNMPPASASPSPGPHGCMPAQSNGCAS